MPAIGENLRSVRRRQGRSLAELATRAGFSKGFLSKIENGHAQPPIATLMKLADALDTPLASLFDGGRRPAARSGGVLTRAAARQREPHSAERGYAFDRLAVGSPFRLTPYLIHLDQPQERVPSFQHAGEEVVHVLAGEMDYAVGATVHRLRRGDTLVFDAAEPHGPIKLPRRTATFLAVFAGVPE